MLLHILSSLPDVVNAAFISETVIIRSIVSCLSRLFFSDLMSSLTAGRRRVNILLRVGRRRQLVPNASRGLFTSLLPDNLPTYT